MTCKFHSNVSSKSENLSLVGDEMKAENIQIFECESGIFSLGYLERT